MNNFFLNQDPLLSNAPTYEQTPILYPQIPQQQIKDCVGELDKTLKGLNSVMLEKLGQNPRFNELNNKFQASVQKEILSLVRNRLNMDSSIVSNINEQIQIIEDVKKSVENEKEESINEMNDYMKNYSHLTFDDYKKMKNGEPIEKDKKKRSIL